MAYYDIKLDLSWEDQQLRDTVNEFARDVMRPIAKELDHMDAKAAAADDSPIWDFMRQSYEMGFHSAMFPEEMGGGGLSPLQLHILNEELAWGSFGLAANLGVACWPICDFGHERQRGADRKVCGSLYQLHRRQDGRVLGGD